MLKKVIFYYCEVFKRAWESTANYCDLSKNSIIKGTFFWITSASIIVYFYPGQLTDEMHTLFIAVSSLALAFVLIFCAAFIIAPSEMDDEKKRKIESLSLTRRIQADAKTIYKTLLIYKEEGTLIARGTYGNLPRNELQDWVSNASSNMHRLGLPLDEIHGFENPVYLSHTPVLEDAKNRVWYLDNLATQYMRQSGQ